MPDALRIVSEFDVGPIVAGVDVAAAAVKTGTQQMAAGFTQATNSAIVMMKAIQATGATVAQAAAQMEAGGVGANAIAAAVQAVTAAAQQAPPALAQTTAAVNAVTAATTPLVQGANNVRVAFTGLTQDLGIHGSRALGSFIAQSQTLGPIISKAFAGIAVLAFVEILDQANKKLAEITDSVAGFGKAAQKAYKEALDANQHAIISNIELNEKVRDLATIGTAGIKKYSLEQENSARTAREMSDAMMAANRQLDQQQELMRHLENAADFWHDPLYGLTGATRALKEGTETLERYKKTVDELQPKVKDRLFVEKPKHEREETVRSRDDELAAERASSEARREIENSYLEYYLSALRQMRAAGQITHDADVDGEIAAVNAKLAEDRRYASERKAQLSVEAKTGKDVRPELESLNAQLISQETAAQQKINEIRSTAEQERIGHANAVSLALAEADKAATEAEVREADRGAKLKLEQLKISDEEYAALLKANNAKEIQAAVQLEEERVRVGSQNAYKNQEAIIRAQGEIVRIKQEGAAKEHEIDADLAKKTIKDQEYALTEGVRLQEEAGKNELEQIRANAEMKSKAMEATSFAGAADPRMIQIADAALDQQAFKIMDLIGLEEQLRQKLIQTGLAETDPKIQESLARQQQLVQQLTVAMQKYDNAVQNVSLKQLKDFKSSFEQISNEFNRSIVGWMNGTETFGRAMAKLWTTMADQAVTALLKIAEQELVGLALHQTMADTQKLSDAKLAAANTYASVSAVPIIGPVLAPAAAAAAFAAVLAFEKGGIVPETGLAMLHSKEMVLPAHISQSVQQMADGGGSGGNLQVHFHGKQAKEDHAGMENQLVRMVKRAQRRGRITRP
jgi:hypothetical protein